MVNVSLEINQSNNSTTVGELFDKGANILTSTTKTISGKIADFITSQGFPVSDRWVSVLLIFISIGLILLGIKITKPILKWIFIILGILLIVGLVIPW